MRIVIAVCSLFLFSANACYASSVGGAVLPNTDVRALEPPIDVTRAQLEAQGTPTRCGETPDYPCATPTVRHKRHKH